MGSSGHENLWESRFYVLDTLEYSGQELSVLSIREETAGEGRGMRAGRICREERDRNTLNGPAI